MIIMFGKQTIIFIRDKNSRGNEVSGYIDYYHRLTSEDFELYFDGSRKVVSMKNSFQLDEND